jgi:hypothetical protein
MIQRLLFLLFLLGSIVSAQTGRRLDTTNFIVVGEGLAAGMANYGLSREVQDSSFPALMASRFGTIFPQPLIQGPGLEGMFGLDIPQARVPTYPQTTVRVFPVNPDKDPGEVDGPTLFVFNLSIPNAKLSESLTRRPTFPIIQPNNPHQSTINLILGFPSQLFAEADNVPLWTQLEYAVAMNPTLALVELGYFEALEAAAAGNPGLMPSAATFRTDYSTVVKRLRALFAEVLVTTIPDPTQTAYFLTPEAAARLLQTDASVLTSKYDLRPGDLLTRIGLYTIGNQFLGAPAGPLPARSILRADAAAEIRSRVSALNAAINEVARENGAVVYDLNAFFSTLRNSGMTAAGRRVTADYLGGFYSLDGVYPSITGHGLIANEILKLVNSTYGLSYQLVDLAPLVARDPAVSVKVPE